MCGALGVAGCGELDDPGSGAGGKADEINPVDSEDLGSLLVHLPSMSGQPNPQHFSIAYRGVQFPVGEPYRVVKGPGDLVVQQLMVDPPSKPITIVGGQTITQTLAAFTARWDASPNGPLAVDFGPTPSLRVRPDGSDARVTSASFNKDGSEIAPFVVIPGDYVIDFGLEVLGEHRTSLDPGEFERIELAGNGKRALLRVHPPQRSFPSPPNPRPCEMTNRHFLVERRGKPVSVGAYAEPLHSDVETNTMPGALNVESFAAFDLTQTKSIRMLPLGDKDRRHYEYVVNNIPKVVTLTPGQTTDLYIKRIDVNDVRLTREDGSTYYVPGTWSVEVETAPGTWQDLYLVGNQYNGTCHVIALGRGEFPTKSGLDVPPGKYKVIIRYQTAEGPKWQEHILNMQ